MLDCIYAAILAANFGCHFNCDFAAISNRPCKLLAIPRQLFTRREIALEIAAKIAAKIASVNLALRYQYKKRLSSMRGIHGARTHFFYYNFYSGRRHGLGFFLFSSSSCCRFCTLNADCFAAPRLTVIISYPTLSFRVCFGQGYVCKELKGHQTFNTIVDSNDCISAGLPPVNQTKW